MLYFVCTCEICDGQKKGFNDYGIVFNIKPSNGYLLLMMNHVNVKCQTVSFKSIFVFPGKLLSLIKAYRQKVLLQSKWTKKSGMRLYEFILHMCDGTLDDTDEDSNHGNDVMGSHGGQEVDPESLEFGSEEILDSDDEMGGGAGCKKLKREDSDDYKANTP
ncbi:hypothetical protein MAR_029456 [Mya arenaria]|uniref:Uncharacterized protein n=1 Tax=Mya arenaria TaxID=6604 RepID=A0ABY7DGE9_MYAAR|nr:hypothetical protein MAR_029456 [Mya arenaria]